MHLRTATFLTILFMASSICGSSDDRSLTTSIDGMDKLLELEETLVQALDTYANELQRKLDTIRSAVGNMREENAKAKNNTEDYLSNPLSGFSLVRRMHADWINWELYMQKPVAEDQIEIIRKHRADVPSITDMAEAVTAIYRLQATYDLKAEDLVSGLLNGKQYNASLTSLDAYAMGTELFNQQQYYAAGFWFFKGIEIYQDTELHAALGFSLQQLFEIYAEVMLKQNRPGDALHIIDLMLTKDPHSAKLLRKRQEVELLHRTNNGPPVVFGPQVPTSYERGCRGEFAQHLSRLHCRYNSTTSAFLKLAPLKMEEIQLDPYMVVYHDVISDSEIADLKQRASPQLKRATVYNEQTKKSMVVSKRTSKFAWFPNDASSAIERINRRIADMTGFDLEGAEMLQVMNYGLGGHYDTHFDFFNVSSTEEVVRTQGDRISTVLFYLSDVEQGGATVFPRLYTAVFPRKGSAVMWYNLNNQGDGDWRTMHAACPVIKGSKWVCNKWIHERSQMFTRPCYKQ